MRGELSLRLSWGFLFPAFRRARGEGAAWLPACLSGRPVFPSQPQSKAANQNQTKPKSDRKEREKEGREGRGSLAPRSLQPRKEGRKGAREGKGNQGSPPSLPLSHGHGPCPRALALLPHSCCGPPKPYPPRPPPPPLPPTSLLLFSRPLLPAAAPLLFALRRLLRLLLTPRISPSLAAASCRCMRRLGEGTREKSVCV